MHACLNDYIYIIYHSEEFGNLDVFLSYLNLRTNPDASQMCARIKSHTYDDLVYKKQCHNFTTQYNLCTR
jgi:hypothetical protein